MEVFEDFWTKEGRRQRAESELPHICTPRVCQERRSRVDRLLLERPAYGPYLSPRVFDRAAAESATFSARITAEKLT